MDGRRARLHQLAAEWGVHNPPPVVPPIPAPFLRTADDDRHAEELLRHRRLSVAGDRRSQGGLIRAFSSNRKSWDLAEIFDALDTHVANAGAPGVACALIEKLRAAGGDPYNADVKGKTAFLGRRRSVESPQQSRLLHKAIENRHADMVAVLVKYAELPTVTAALPLALSARDLAVISLLLGRGANLSDHKDAQSAFRNLCIDGGFDEIVGLLLQSSHPPPPNVLSMCMVDAARKGCLPTVVRLSRAAADGEYNKGEALKEAIGQCRADIVLAILTGTKPPATGGQAVLESFSRLLTHGHMGVTQKIAIAEALLCAGASGDAVSDLLAQACEAEFYDMVNLLVSYGASIEHQDAAALRGAIARGKAGIVQLLLTDRSTLSPIYASECLTNVPKIIAPEDRHFIFSLLLRKGASGTPLHEALIDAVRAGDLPSVELLVTPHFPGAQSITNTNRRSSTPGVILVRHDVASLDYKAGLALKIAVGAGNLPMVRLLLAGRPSTATLDQVFAAVLALAPATRYSIAECFLAAGLSHESISAALQHAIEEQPPRRDDRLIGMLLHHNADVNFNNGAGILSAITIRDLTLLETLLTSRLSPQTAAAAMARAMSVEDRLVRYDMVRLLVGAGAGGEGSEVSLALVQVLSVRPADIELAALLLQHGNADANFDHGMPVALTVDHPDPTLLELVLCHGVPSPDTLYRGLDALTSNAAIPERLTKVEALLRRGPDKASLGQLLWKEVQILVTTPPTPSSPNTDTFNPSSPLGVLRALLAAGADVNAHNAAAFAYAVKAADGPIVDLFLTPPASSHTISPASLAIAMPHALNIAGPVDRLDFTKRLISAGAPRQEATKALAYALTAHSHDVALIALLAGHAAERFTDGDGEVGRDVLLAAVKGGDVEVLGVVVRKARGRFKKPALTEAFIEATKLADRQSRVGICTILLAIGVDKNAVSDALVVAAKEGDLALGKILLEHGASVELADGQSIVEASGAGEAGVVAMLLAGSKSKISQGTLDKAFHAAGEVADLAKRATVFDLLLEKGVSADALDAQLVAAARFGKAGEPLVRLLLQFGASVDHDSGEAIWNATRGGALGSVKLMLGVENGTEGHVQQKKPALTTLLRALKASRRLGRDERYQVISWLFEAGLPSCEEIAIALHRAVKEEPDPRLVQLLLAHGASPLTNGCETLIDAAQGLQLEILTLLLATNVPEKDISWTFQQAFTPEAADAWLSERGFQVAKMLLDRGAQGEGLALALGAAIDFYGTEKDGLARRFVAALLNAGADVNGQDGLVVQMAAQKADSELIQQILARKPNSHSTSMAFPYIFDAGLAEAEVLVLMELFLECQEGEERLDVMFNHPRLEPVIFHAADTYPRSVSVLEALLNAGYYHDQVTKARVLDEIEEPEDVNLLMWMLLQPQKRVSSAVIELLVDRGANVNFETSVSMTTPMMVAIRQRRHDVARALLLAGAEVDVVDATGNTPMTLVAQVPGDQGISMMTSILAADPSPNDGSLHNAARDLNVRAMQVLIQHGYDPDFPSTLHGGRSALGELCLNAAGAEPISPAREKQMEKAMSFLIQAGSDLTIQCDGKSILLLALHSADPYTTTKALLKAGLWKHVNQSYHQFTDGKHTYSPTQYVARVLSCEDGSARERLLSLLKANRAIDVYYANDGPQPADAVNLPPELLRAERERRAREEYKARDEEEHRLALARTKQVAEVQNQLFLARAELEDARARRRIGDELAAARARHEADEAAFRAELRRRQEARTLDVEHEQRLTEAGLTRARLVAEAQLELDARRHEEEERWASKVARRREAEAQALSDLRLTERRAVERIEAAADERLAKRLEQQTKLVEEQAVLAAQIAASEMGSGAQRRQIGFVTGELD
ncbi:hypothetical protein VTJ83DRAFT_4306 [Remersonia thermophila]|uniref:Uncharacterized protein n=1 Tax=Remersonia thermophila TaxID=72144 RepID=A0ABR4DBM9_9PEZI